MSGTGADSVYVLLYLAACPDDNDELVGVFKTLSAAQEDAIRRHPGIGGIPRGLRFMEREGAWHAGNWKIVREEVAE
jgi:hypothetical protein